MNSNSFNENAFYIQSTIDQNLQKVSEKALIDNLALCERKYNNWAGSFNNLEDILKFKNDHWHVAKVISKNKNLIKLSIINSDLIINLDINNNLYGPKKVPPNIYLSLNE